MKKYIFILIFLNLAIPALAWTPLPNLFSDDVEFTRCVEIVNSVYGPSNSQTASWGGISNRFSYVSSGYRHDIVNVTVNFTSNGRTQFSGYVCSHDGITDLNSTDLFSTLDKKLYNRTQKDQIACGSVIDYDKKVLTEQIPISGTNFILNYSSNYNENSRSIRLISDQYQQLENIHGQTRIRILAGASQPVEVFLQPNILSTGPIQFNFLPDLNQVSAIETDFFKKNTFQLLFEYALTLGGLSSPIYNSSGELTGYSLPEPTTEWLSRSADSKDIVVYKSKVWGLKGWTISEHHYFDRNQKKLYLGSGFDVIYDDYKTVLDPIYGLIDLVVNKNTDTLIYKFDQQGRHLETYNNDLKYIIYKFEYENNRIKKIFDRSGKFTEFAYDTQTNISKIISPYGLETNILTSDDEITEVISPTLKKYKMTYNQNKILTSFKNANGVLTSFTYNDYDQIISEQKNNGIGQSFIENFVGNIKESIQFKFFGANKKISTQRTTTQLISSEYDSEDRIVKTNNQNILNPVLSSDIFDQTQIKYNTSQDSVFRDYSWKYYTNLVSTESGQNISQANFNSKSKYYFDATNPLTSYQKTETNRIADINQLVLINNQNKSILSQDAANNSSYLDFNNLGLITKLRPANQYPTDITYNADGKIIKKQKGTEWTSYGYDQYGYLNQESNSNNQTAAYINDIEGKILEKTLPNGDKVKFEYTDGNEIKKITAPNNQVHYFQMSLGDFITNAVTPNNKNTAFEYDADKRITKITKPSSKEIIYNYKPQSANLQSISTPSGILTINDIDARKRLRSITSADAIKTEIDWAHTQVQEQRFFDTDGSLIGKVTNNFKSDELKINQIKINDQTIANYNFDSAGRVSSVNQASYQYSNYGYVKSQIVNFNGMTATYAAEDSDSGNKPVQMISANIKENPNLQLFMTMKRSFDTFGNATEFSQATINSQTGVYNNFYTLTPTYDANSRLIQIAKNRKSYINGQQINSTDFLNEYVYPQNSNNNVKEYNQRTTPSSNPIKRTIASHTNDDALTKLTGSINRDYVYNDDGDLKSMTNCFGTINFEYDVFGNLKKVTLADGKIIEYKVDGLNRRIKKLINGITKEYYLWYDQTHIAAILDENKITKLTYIYGPESQISPSYVVKNGTTYKVLHDPGLGSIRYIIDPQTQQIMQEVEYDENGNIMKNTNPDFQPILFSGGLYDFDTKLTRFGARDYDPTVGRWTTKDPIGFNGGDTNLYAYVGGNPMSYVDPSGLWGFGAIGSGSAEAGVGYGAGATGAVGAGIFGGGLNGINGGAFASGGAFAGGPGHSVGSPQCQDNQSGVAGGFAGVGGGGFITNATSASQLGGYFDTYSVNVGIGPIKFSGQLSSGGGIWIGGITFGPGIGLSGSTYPTNTFTTGGH